MRISDWSSDVCSSDLVHDVGYTAFLQSKNDCFKIRGPGAFGDPAQLAAILGGAGILRFGLGDLSESGFVGLDLLEDFLGLGMSLLRSEEHTSELQSLMRISYAVFCLKKKKKQTHTVQ